MNHLRHQRMWPLINLSSQLSCSTSTALLPQKMYYWIRIASFLIFLQSTKSDDPGALIELGQGRCQRQWTIPERKIDVYTVREHCKYYERCYYKTVTKTRTKIVEKAMHVDFCCAGYVNQGLSDSLQCEPTCEPMCVNGECTAPGNCTCRPGYGKSPSSNHVCEHECVPECVNATCVGVNDCDCYAGFFKKDPATSPHACSPRCTFGCVHGDCTAPEHCTCHPGYTLSSNGSICVPVCNLECTNAYCSAPNACTCDDGYEESLLWNVCNPYCSEPCIHGQCTSPENCTCWDGFVKTTNTTCEPHCTNPCHNGVCVAPETCSCIDGYEKDENDTCIPICSLGCENGTCVSPDNCLCNERHYFSNGACLPWCADGCVNGDCTGPNECSCHQGTFKLSQSHCAISCSNTCVNYSISVDINSTTLNLEFNSSNHCDTALCAQRASQYCCSTGLNFTRHDSLIITCALKNANDECEDDMNVPDYLSTRRYEKTNGTNVTVTVMYMAETENSLIDHDASPFYFTLCPGPEFGFVSGPARILCSKDQEIGDLIHDKRSHPTTIVTIGATIFLIAVAILCGIFRYFTIMKKVSYEVNDGAVGESTAQLCDGQEMTIEDEL